MSTDNAVIVDANAQAAAAAAAQTGQQQPTYIVLNQPPVQQPAAEAAKPNEQAATEQAPAVEAIAYEPTNDPGLDMALEFIGNMGIGPDHPSLQRAMAGDFTLIEAHLAALGDKAKGWERFIALGKNAYEQNKTKSEAALNETAQAVSAAVGGDQAWLAIQKWASTNATPEEKTHINAMFDAGPMQARAAALMLKGLYDAKADKSPASATRFDASGNEIASPKGKLNRRQLVTEVEKLRRSHGANFQQTPEYRELHARVSAR